MRLVMLYSVGDGFTYSCDIVEPIVYESKELAILDFGSKILEVEEKREVFEKEYSLWMNRLNSLSSSDKKLEHYQNQPQFNSDQFEFGGQTFSASSFYTDEYDHKKQKSSKMYCEPDFLTLDEWFKNQQ